MRLFRLYDSKYASDPISGRGAFKVGGRWNEKNTYALYTASTPELAMLESIFRVSPDNLPAYHLLILEVDDALIVRLDISTLPPGWRERTYSGQPVQVVLQDWFADRLTPCIIVPSALVPLSTNIVLNPQFPDFKNLLTIIDNSPYSFE